MSDVLPLSKFELCVTSTETKATACGAMSVHKLPELSPILNPCSATPISQVVSGPVASYNLKQNQVVKQPAMYSADSTVTVFSCLI